MFLFSDNHLLVALKPAGISTQEGFDRRAKEWIKERYQKPGAVFLQPVHRLDKPVSGLLLFARTSKALSRLQEQMRGRKMRKTYLALVEGRPPAKEATLEHYLLHASFHARIAQQGDPEAKHALLHYRTLEQRRELTLIEIELFTGRYHQIRAQLSAIGCPIWGDTRYGSCLPFPEEGIALHHSRLLFTHPVTQEELEFSTPSQRPSLALSDSHGGAN